MSERICISCNTIITKASSIDPLLCLDCEHELKKMGLTAPLAFLEH